MLDMPLTGTAGSTKAPVNMSTGVIHMPHAGGAAVA
jgi:hypothetical protein